MEKFGSLSELLGAFPGGIDVSMLRELLDQSMCLLTKFSSLGNGKLSLDEHITIFIVEAALLLCQHHNLPFSFFSILKASLATLFSISGSCTSPTQVAKNAAPGRVFSSRSNKSASVSISSRSSASSTAPTTGSNRLWIACTPGASSRTRSTNASRNNGEGWRSTPPVNTSVNGISNNPTFLAAAIT